MYLKLFWTQLEIVHLQGPCCLKPCSSRPYCTSQTSSYLYGQPEFQKEFISAEEAKRIVATKYVATVPASCSWWLVFCSLRDFFTIIMFPGMARRTHYRHLKTQSRVIDHKMALNFSRTVLTDCGFESHLSWYSLLFREFFSGLTNKNYLHSLWDWKCRIERKDVSLFVGKPQRYLI